MIINVKILGQVQNSCNFWFIKVKMCANIDVMSQKRIIQWNCPCWDAKELDQLTIPSDLMLFQFNYSNEPTSPFVNWIPSLFGGLHLKWLSISSIYQRCTLPAIVNINNFLSNHYWMTSPIPTARRLYANEHRSVF